MGFWDTVGKAFNEALDLFPKQEIEIAQNWEKFNRLREYGTVENFKQKLEFLDRDGVESAILDTTTHMQYTIPVFIFFINKGLSIEEIVDKFRLNNYRYYISRESILYKRIKNLVNRESDLKTDEVKEIVEIIKRENVLNLIEEYETSYY